ncbi:MAG: FIST C-terminal domain-containing protein [Myxococcales bacterium]|nr:FIST C-terminal domain-containing protein [Myxococcales bacterium]
MHCALSELSDTAAALKAAIDDVVAALGGPPDVTLVFTTPHHAAAWSRLPAMVTEHLPTTQPFGCTAAGVIGDGHEVEQRCGLVIVGLRLPGVSVSAHHLDPAALPSDQKASNASPASDNQDDAHASEQDGQQGGEQQEDGGWSALLPGPPPALAIILGDPLSADMPAILPGLSATWPGTPVVGGLASGGKVPGSHALFAGGRCHRIGAIVLALRGPLQVETIVAQGCRPIGEPMLITACDGRLVKGLAGREPVTLLRELYQTLSKHDQALFRHSLFAGVEMSGDHEVYEQGDFVIRQITGMEPEHGAISIAATVKPWQVLQFHLRDARTAAEDLTRRLAASDAQPECVLMFSCVGRGLHLFGRPDHDTDLIRQRFGDIPIAGLFGSGEIGPVGSELFLHGYTTVVTLLSRPKSDASRLN